MTDAEYLERHGWQRVAGTRKYGPGGFRATYYWRDPSPTSLEPMQPQSKAINIQKRRLRGQVRAK